MKLNLVYFAWLKQSIGTGGESVDAPVQTVAQLIAWLRGQSGGHGEAFGKDAVLRAAVNKRIVSDDHALQDGDEVAFFPPFTGG
jgi:molybdopterin synthase sulfur carrier subunit